MEQRLFTKREQETFEQICKLRQTGVINMMRQFLNRKYGKNNVIATPAYLIAKGNIPVALVAHADTVFKHAPTEFFYDKDQNVLWSPDGLGADDRAGIFAITRIVGTGLRPHVIITTDEECGCLGASKMVRKYKDHPFDELKFIIQLDRRNFVDSVYYDCANKDFEDFITPFGFTTEWGTLSDISVIAPYWGVAAVNFSIGYVEEHSKQERLYVGAMFETIRKVENILEWVAEHPECPEYEYIEDYSYNRYYSGWYDDGYEMKPVGNFSGCCSFCGRADKPENLLLVNWEDAGGPFYLCNECYASMHTEIEWCSKCNKGWVLDDNEVADLKDKDRTQFVCKECKNKEVKVNDGQNSSTEVGTSSSILSESVSRGYGETRGSMASGESAVSRKITVAYL